MDIAQSRNKRLLSILSLAILLGGGAGLAQASGYTIINPDGTRTHVQGTYTCPAGYTCTNLPARPPARPVPTQSEVNYDQIGNSTTAYTGAPVYYYGPAPVYYGNYPYYGPMPPYFWPPLFFGFGYYWGGHHHHHHHPRTGTPPPSRPAAPTQRR